MVVYQPRIKLPLSAGKRKKKKYRQSFSLLLFPCKQLKRNLAGLGTHKFAGLLSSIYLLSRSDDGAEVFLNREITKNLLNLMRVEALYNILTGDVTVVKLLISLHFYQSSF